MAEPDPVTTHTPNPPIKCFCCGEEFPCSASLEAHLNEILHDSKPSPFGDFLIKPPTILDEAAAIISGPRRESYGPVEESFSKVATVASALLSCKLSSPLDGKDVAMFMLAMKLCREANLPAYDNRLDAIGYLALLDQLHSANPSKEPAK